MVYQKEVSKVLEECKSSVNGLTKEQVKEHREIYGENALAEKKNDSTLVIFLKQFKDLLVIILIIAAVISGLNKQLESAIVIVVVITLNAILGTVQTLKAQKSLDSLKKLSVPKVKVMRDGQLTEIDSTELTVGDIVQIEAGDIVSVNGIIFPLAFAPTIFSPIAECIEYAKSIAFEPSGNFFTSPFGVKTRTSSPSKSFLKFWKNVSSESGLLRNSCS